MKHNNIFLLLTLTIIFSSLPASAEEKLSENETLIGKASEYMESGEYDEALKTELKVAGNLKNEKDLIIHVNVYNDLGVIYRHLNKNDSALYYYHKALETATELKDKEWLATLTMNLAVFYHNLNHFSDAETYADMAVKYSKEQNEEELFFYACQIAAPIKTEVKKHEEALKYAKKAWEVANGKEGDDNMRLRCIPSLTSIFDAMKQTDSVFHYIDIGTRLIEGTENHVAKIGFLQCRAEIYYRHHRWRSALKDMLFLSKVGATLNTSLYRKIADCYYNIGEYNRAFCYMDTARMWTDSLAAKDIEGKMAEFNVKYETKEKEMLLAEERSKHADLQVKWMTTILVAVLLIAVLVVILLIVRHRHRLHLLFVRQCAELKEAQQYIDGLECERARMARELHDSISNGLLGISLKIQGAQSPDDVRSLLTDVEHLRSEARTLSHGLMPPEFSKHNIHEIFGLYIDTLKDVRVSYSGSDSECWNSLSKEVSLEVFRIAQECISNALTHSDADNIRVSLAMASDNTEGILKVDDNGRVDDNGKKAGYPYNGIGLRVISERVKYINGHIDIQRKDSGTSVCLYFPITMCR